MLLGLCESYFLIKYVWPVVARTGCKTGYGLIAVTLLCLPSRCLLVLWRKGHGVGAQFGHVWSLRRHAHRLQTTRRSQAQGKAWRQRCCSLPKHHWHAGTSNSKLPQIFTHFHGYSRKSFGCRVIVERLFVSVKYNSISGPSRKEIALLDRTMRRRFTQKLR